MVADVDSSRVHHRAHVSPRQQKRRTALINRYRSRSPSSYYPSTDSHTSSDNSHHRHTNYSRSAGHRHHELSPQGSSRRGILQDRRHSSWSRSSSGRSRSRSHSSDEQWRRSDDGYHRVFGQSGNLGTTVKAFAAGAPAEGPLSLDLSILRRDTTYAHSVSPRSSRLQSPARVRPPGHGLLDSSFLVEGITAPFNPGTFIHRHQLHRHHNLVMQQPAALHAHAFGRSTVAPPSSQLSSPISSQHLRQQQHQQQQQLDPKSGSNSGSGAGVNTGAAVSRAVTLGANRSSGRSSVSSRTSKSMFSAVYRQKSTSPLLQFLKEHGLNDDNSGDDDAGEYGDVKVNIHL
jgi:hypothetical protein